MKTKIFMAILLFISFSINVVAQKPPNATDYAPKASPEGKYLTYYSFREGVPKIFVCDANGKNDKAITDGKYWATLPIWSNDGKKIAYRDNRNGKDNDIYVMNVDGSNVEKLVGFEGGDETPIGWSKDNKTFFFAGYLNGSKGDIFSVDIASGTVKNLTNRPEEKDYWGSYSPKTGKIVYESTRGEQKEVYMMNEDGTMIENISNDKSNDETPAITKDGKYIVFRSNREGATAQYCFNVSNGNTKRITDLNSKSFFASWAADNKTVLFDSDRCGGYSIFSKNINDDKIKRITYTGSHNASPSIAENGTIVFESKRDGNLEIYMMNEKGKNLVRLTNDASSDATPKIAFDKRKVVFVSDRTGNTDIYTIDIKSKDITPKNITNNSSTDDSPAISYDGKLIAFVSNRDGGKRIIHIMNSDGTNVRSTNVEGELPNWGVDGRLTFTKNVDKNWEVFTMWPEGTDIENVSNKNSVDFYSNWSVEGDKIVFASNQYSEKGRGPTAIYIMDRLGNEVTQITKNPDSDVNPSIMRNGKVVFESRRNMGNKQIYIVNKDGSDLKQLTDDRSGK